MTVSNEVSAHPKLIVAAVSVALFCVQIDYFAWPQAQQSWWDVVCCKASARHSYFRCR